MQELDVQPTNPTPYTPAGGTYNLNPTPGAGGLPALSGLTRNINPMANELQSQGRGQDSMLVHMTPNEVNSLQGLAMAHGGSLTINPNTGLPEAGFLSKILPTLLGVGLSFIPGVGPALAAGIVGAGTTAVTGDLQKGLMAGLGAFGGASVAGALTAAPATAALPEVGVNLAPGATTSAATSGLTIPADIAAMGTGAAAPVASTTLQAAAPTLGQTIASQAPRSLLTAGTGAAAPSSGILGKFGSDFSTAAREGLKAGTLPYKLAPAAAGLGALGTVSDVLQPEMQKYQKEEDKWKYEGPYMPMPRRLRPTSGEKGEISYFEDSNPYPGYLPAASAGYAEGGETEQKAAPAAAMLPEMVKMFQTSPGPITASRTYPGGSPSELIRAAAQANAAKPTNEVDFGFAKKAAAAPSGVVNPYAGGYTDPFTTDYSTYINDFLANFNYGADRGPGGGAGGAGAGGGRDTTTTNIMTGENPRTTSGTNYTPPSVDTSFGDYTPPTYTPPTYTPPTYTPPSDYTPFSNDVVPDVFTPTYDYTNIPVVDYGALNDYISERASNYGGGPRDFVERTYEFAKGGGIRMDDGAFVVDARTVSELGNGSSNAGQELLARLGGRPVKGPGDGVSDSIPANIGGTQEARVARDEVIFPAKAVKRLGGAKKLYALMDKAHKARKKAGRGSDTKLRKGLGAL